MSDQICRSRELCEIFLRISPERFHAIKFILEGYDNLALLSSVDHKKGVVRLRCSRELMPELFSLLTAIAKDLHSLASSGNMAQ